MIIKTERETHRERKVQGRETHKFKSERKRERETKSQDREIRRIGSGRD